MATTIKIHERFVPDGIKPSIVDASILDLIQQDEMYICTTMRRNFRTTFTHILENRFPLFPGADGIRAPHYHTLRVDTEVLAISRFEGYPATAKMTKLNSTVAQTEFALSVF